MRVLSVVLSCALLACVVNPDPREPTPESMQTTGKGAWIVVERRDATVIQGELLAIDHGVIYVKEAARQETSVPLYNVQHAEVFKYESDWGFGLWGALGTVSTISHGAWLIFSVPLWIISASIAARTESSHVRLQIPEDDIDEIVKWARFPQGMPERKVKPPSGRDEAWRLTKQAQQDARDGRCGSLAELAEQIRNLDAEIYALTFLRDEAIRRCLGMPSLLAPPGMSPTTSPTSPPTGPSTAPPAAPSDAGVPVDAIP
jgi:hypothetical protein